MELSHILAKCDHTLLAPTATWEDIQAICDDGIRYGTASVCIPAAFVAQAKQYVGSKLPICTVIGFPNGYDTTAAKCYMACDAVANGADEIDMVINIGWLKEGKDDALLEEIRQVKAHCQGRILKVIIETCLLTREEKIRMCHIVTQAGADYIKTSTGFSTAGATFDDVALFAAHVGENVKIKAAGGISSLADAEEFIRLGADRLGTSRIVKLAKAEDSNSSYLNRIRREKSPCHLFKKIVIPSQCELCTKNSKSLRSKSSLDTGVGISTHNLVLEIATPVTAVTDSQ